MGYHVVPLKEDLIETLCSLILEQEENAKDCLVVFPGKRPTFFLRKYLARASGKALRSPAIFSMDGLVADIYEKNASPLKTANNFDMIAILLNILQRDIGKGLVNDDSRNTDLLLPLAISLSEELEELENELITPQELSSFNDMLQDEIRKGLYPYSDDKNEERNRKNDENGDFFGRIYGKLSSFSAIYGNFYEIISSKGLVTKAGKAAWVAKFVNADYFRRYKRIYVAGFLRRTKAEQRIFDCMEKAGADFLVQENALLEKYYSFLKQDKEENPDVGGRISFYRAADMHGEIYRLAELLADDRDSLDEHCAAVLPDSKTLFPLLLNALPNGCKTNISMECPISVSPVYSLFSIISSLFVLRQEQGYPIAAYMDFIRHPYIKNLKIDGESVKGRIAAQALESVLSESFRHSFDPSEHIEFKKCPIPSETVSRHLTGIYEDFIRPFENISDIADFCRKLTRIYTLVAKNGTASLHPYWGEFSSALSAAAEDLRNSGLGAEKLTDSASYFRFFGLMLKKIGYPFQGTPVEGFQVLGPIETRGLKFKKIYFLDANADVLPMSGKKNRVISDFLRRQLGLVTHRQREEESRFYFETLVGSAEEINIFYCDSAEKEKSPFLEKIIWNKERQGIATKSEPAFFTPSFVPKEPQPVQKNPEIMSRLYRIVLSPSSLDNYLKCGLSFFYANVLGIEDKRSASDSLEKKDIGTLVHKMLETFFREKIGRPLSVDLYEDTARLRQIAQEILDGKFGNTDTGFEFIFKRQIFRRCADIISYHEKLASSGISILKLETDLHITFNTRFGQVEMKGRADRIDDRNGTVFVVDYKTGSSADVPNLSRFSLEDREAWPKTLKSVQLPFYLQACSNEYTGFKNASLMLLGAENIDEKKLFPDKNARKNSMSEEEKLLAQDRLCQTIRILAEEILDPDIPFVSTDDKDRCRSCPFAITCGRV